MKTKADGRKFRLPRTESPKDLLITRHHLDALAFIHRHTLVASNTLFEFMRPRLEVGWRAFTCRDKRARGFLPKLFDADLIYRPPAQRYTEYPDSHFDVYAITPRGENLLRKHKRYEEVVKHSGQFPHQLMGATYTATIEIMCERNDLTFIPAHKILKHSKKVEIPFYWDDKLITKKPTIFYDPDYVFGIKFPKQTIAYIVEFNRDTEPYTTKSPFRRSDSKTLRQAGDLITRQLYHKLYGFTHPCNFLFITVTEEHAKKFIEMAGEQLEKNHFIKTAVMPTFDSPFKPPYFSPELFDGEYLSTNGPWTIKKTAP